MPSQRPIRRSTRVKASSSNSSELNKKNLSSPIKKSPRKRSPKRKSKTPLPRIGCNVNLWFSGYDRYYRGEVQKHKPPDRFDVLLKDGSTWPVDRINNIWEYVSSKDDPMSKNYQPHVEDDNEDEQENAAEEQEEPKTPTSARKRTGRALRKNVGSSSKQPTRATDSAPSEDTGDEITAVQPSTRRRGRPSNASRDSEDEDVVKPELGLRRSTRNKTSTPDSVFKKPTGRVTRSVMNAKKRELNSTSPQIHPKKKTRSNPAFLGNANMDADNLTPHAVTAVAVDSALASATEVIRPVLDKVEAMSDKLDDMRNEIKELYSQLAQVKTKQTAVTPEMSSKVSKAALDSLNLDLSEVVGGGQARMKAYKLMSQAEFDTFKQVLMANAEHLMTFESMIVEIREEAEKKKIEEEKKKLEEEEKKKLEEEEMKKAKEMEKEKNDGDEEMLDNQENQGDGAEKADEAEPSEASGQSAGNGSAEKPVTRDPKGVTKRVTRNSA